VERVKESTRDDFRPAIVEDALRDVRYGTRALRRAPGFTVVATLTLGLNMSAATAVGVARVMSSLLFGIGRSIRSPISSSLLR
jgi:hypothetical protein